MADQNNAPERIWIKPCDPCENPYDYYVCDPRYLDGRETSYVKSIVSCAGCGGGLKRQSGQFVCRDCGKAETVQEVLARADRAAPEGQVRALEWEEIDDGKAFRAFLPIIGSVRVEPYGCCGWWEVLWSMPGQCDKLIPDVFDNPNDAKAAAQADYERRILAALTPPPAAPTDNTALVDELRAEISDLQSNGLFSEASLLERAVAALANHEAPPEKKPFCRSRGNTGGIVDAGDNGEVCWASCPVCHPPACQQEAVTVAEASHRLIVGFMLDCNVIGHVAAAENLVRGIKDHVAALRALKGEQK